MLINIHNNKSVATKIGKRFHIQCTSFKLAEMSVKLVDSVKYPRLHLVAARTCKLSVDHLTRGSAIEEGPCDALVSRNSATTKYPYRVALFVLSLIHISEPTRPY